MNTTVIRTLSTLTALFFAAAIGATDYNVATEGELRTAIQADGGWNTLCLPFDVLLAGSPLEGATVKELDTEGFYDTDKQTSFDTSDGTLHLYFKDASAIEAGKPYLIKWNSGDNITNPIFSGTSISKDKADIVSKDGSVSFKGIYGPVTLTGGDQSNLFLSTDNTLYYPVADKTIKPFRAYFHVDRSGGLEIKAFVLRFGDEATGVQSVQAPEVKGQDSGWYDLQGRKLNGTPALKGVNIINGQKVLINR